MGRGARGARRARGRGRRRRTAAGRDPPRAAVCRRVRAATGLAAVAMAGGVFQNRLLADECEAVLAADGFEVLAAGLVPVNDGGVALGQAAVAGYTSLKRRGELG